MRFLYFFTKPLLVARLEMTPLDIIRHGSMLHPVRYCRLFFWYKRVAGSAENQPSKKQNSDRNSMRICIAVLYYAWSRTRPRNRLKLKASKHSLKALYSCGLDGTRTRDLRRDRAAF